MAGTCKVMADQLHQPAFSKCCRESHVLQAGMIEDDVINHILVNPPPRAVQLHAVMHSHGGTVRMSLQLCLCSLALCAVATAPQLLDSPACNSKRRIQGLKAMALDVSAHPLCSAHLNE